MRRESVGDKRPEEALQELEHAVESVGASSSGPVFVKEVCRMAAGEAPAEPVGYAGLLAPSGEERQFGPVAAHGVLAEVFCLPADIVGGCLHDGNPLRGCGIPANQRVPAVVEFAVDFRAEQGCVFCPLAGGLDAVASDAHALEPVAGRVEHVVADVNLLVAHHLRGSEIDEWCSHRKKDDEIIKLYI